MASNNTYLFLRLENDGFLYDDYSGLIIKNSQEMPTNILLFRILNYYKYKKYLDNDLMLKIEDNYRIHDDYSVWDVDYEYDEVEREQEDFMFVYFINKNCNYEIYTYLNDNNIFKQKYWAGGKLANPEGKHKRVQFSLEDMVKKIKGPCIVRDFYGRLRWYENLNDVDQIQPRKQQRFMEVDAIYKHFSFKRVTYYGRDNVGNPKGKLEVDVVTYRDMGGNETYNNGYYIMDAKTNFCTKQATKKVG